MEDVLNGGKIVVVGMPALDSIDGRIANGLMQFVFCRKAPRIPRRNNAFLISDECQETITREVMRKVAILREFRVATILLTQNLAVLDDKIGQTAREGLCGLMTTKIFCTQSESATRQWAAEQIGKIKTPVETKTKGRSSGKHGQGSNSGSSSHEVWDYRVPPSRFAELAVGETICLRDGDAWLARWHRETPGRNGTVRVL
jgi:type IV secretory pathway TraG/TraD family ATPase VirD4